MLHASYRRFKNFRRDEPWAFFPAGEKRHRPLLVDKKFYFAAVEGFLGVVGKSDEVAAVPGEAFGRSGFLRFSYALADDDLVEGITRVQELLS